ncbi:MAG: hypothetical protein LBE83_04535 [Propionibacteriaceae bacterium]|jgi:hypothetical protein|nr:hypothetical protein [Propionibacteriaceae bacterium]
MTTITLTEFNRNPSLIARLARTRNVIITDHGAATLEIRRIDSQGSRLDELRRLGQVRPVRDRSSDPFPDFEVDPALASRLMAAFEEERDQREY